MGVGLTGIAGAAGGTETKPAGPVAIAVAGPADALRVRVGMFPGTRHHVKMFSATTAIDMVRRALI